MKPLVVGITGGIASGKSVVSAKIQALGGMVIDADILSREVIEKGTKGHRLLKEAFPIAFDGDELNRKALRELVFNDEQARAKLNSITHPLIEERTKALIENANQEVVFLVVPLMFESKSDKFCSLVVSVCAPKEKRVEWITKRNSEITKDLAEKMISAQMSDEERAERADEVIYNDGTLEDLESKAIALYKRFIENKN